MAYRIRWTMQQRADFIERWLGFRAKYKLSQEGLARAMGVHVNTVQRVEKGKYVPQNETVLRFREVEKRYRTGKALERVPGADRSDEEFEL